MVGSWVAYSKCVERELSYHSARACNCNWRLASSSSDSITGMFNEEVAPVRSNLSGLVSNEFTMPSLEGTDAAISSWNKFLRSTYRHSMPAVDKDGEQLSSSTMSFTAVNGGLYHYSDIANCFCDTGYGCTVRSVQSLVASAIIRAGEHARIRGSHSTSGVHAVPPEVPTLEECLRVAAAAIVDWPTAALSFQKFLSVGGKREGHWWGPHEACAVARELVGSAGGAIPLSMTLQPDATVADDQLMMAAGCADDRDSASWDKPVLMVIPLRLSLDGKLTVSQVRCLTRLMRLPAFAGAVGGRPRHSVLVVGAVSMEMAAQLGCVNVPGGTAGRSGNMSSTGGANDDIGSSGVASGALGRAAALLGLQPSVRIRSDDDAARSQVGSAAAAGYRLLVLDPHVTQACPPYQGSSITTGSSASGSSSCQPSPQVPIQPPPSFIASLRPPSPPASMDPALLDPSIALAYLFASKTEYEEWRDGVKQVWDDCCDGIDGCPPMFEVVARRAAAYATAAQSMDGSSVDDDDLDQEGSEAGLLSRGRQARSAEDRDQPRSSARHDDDDDWEVVE